MNPATIERLQAAMARYREAFEHCQTHLRATSAQGAPQWVFALDALPLDEVREYGIRLAEAEEKRRTARAALHALVELLALHGETLPGDDPTSWIAAGAAEAVDNHAWHDSLDRFISVMNHARDAGVMYVNGDFRPSDDPGSDSTDEWAIPDFASLGLPNANPARAED